MNANKLQTTTIGRNTTKKQNMFHCLIGECIFVAKRWDGITTHQSYKHDMNVRYLVCGLDGCQYKLKTCKERLAIHQLKSHGIGNFSCSEKKCNFKSNTKDDIISHKFTSHGIVQKEYKRKMFYCDHDDCAYKADSLK